jgi:hypothetical protein
VQLPPPDALSDWLIDIGVEAADFDGELKNPFRTVMTVMTVMTRGLGLVLA